MATVDPVLVLLAKEALHKAAFVDPNQLAMAEQDAMQQSAAADPSQMMAPPGMVDPSMQAAPMPMDPSMGAATPPVDPQVLASVMSAAGGDPSGGTVNNAAASGSPPMGVITIHVRDLADLIAAARSGKTRDDAAMSRLEAENKKLRSMMGMPEQSATEPTGGGKSESAEKVPGELGPITKNPMADVAAGAAGKQADIRKLIQRLRAT